MLRRPWAAVCRDCDECGSCGTRTRQGDAVIRVEDRDVYLAVLESASIDQDIGPLARFVAERVQWSLEQAARVHSFAILLPVRSIRPRHTICRLFASVTVLHPETPTRPFPAKCSA